MKTAMVWGAGGGIGRALVKTLHEDGWMVLAISRRPLDLNNQAKLGIEADVTSASDVQAAITTVSQKVTAIDLWIYAIGDILSERVAQMPPEVWMRVVNANLSGAYLATQTC